MAAEDSEVVLKGEWSGTFKESGGRQYPMCVWIDGDGGLTGTISGRVNWLVFRDSTVGMRGTIDGAHISWQQTDLISEMSPNGAKLVIGGEYRGVVVENRIDGHWIGKNSGKLQGNFTLYRSVGTSSKAASIASEQQRVKQPKSTIVPEFADDIEITAKRCRDLLPLGSAVLGSEYGYQHLPLCILDAVWSIGVRYTGVQNVVSRYCTRYGVDANATSTMASHTTDDLITNIQSVGASRFAVEIVSNSQRTSATGGVLKAEAVLRFAQALQRHGIQSRESLPKYGGNDQMEQELRQVPGQGSGKSLKYFFMLAGDRNLVKPDRMTLGFLAQAIGRKITDDEAQILIAGASAALRDEFPHLTPRELDHEIWKYQRSHASSS